jgi:hypothetical protein
MEYDVFVSYSHPDKASADAACATLEQAGIRCWIAPRDIVPGTDWSESIINAIEGAKVFVLIFSKHANVSPQIKREVERAVSKGVPIIPVRIEDTAPSKALEYFISTPHWLDAFTPPLEERLTQLAAAVRALLGTLQAPGSAQGKLGLLHQPEVAPTGLMARLMAAHRAVKGIGVAAAVCALAIVGAGLALLSGATRAALVILAVALAGLLLLFVISLFVTGKNPTFRSAARASGWAVSALLLVFFALAATASTVRWPPVTASLLGIEDGVVCGRPGEPLQAFTCGVGEAGYVVVNIRHDDLDAGLMVRERPEVGALGKPIPANATGVGITGTCNREVPDTWCEVQCKSKSLTGWSRARYLAPRTDTLYTLSGAVPADEGGLVMRTGPHQSCHAVAVVPPEARDVIQHSCQRSPLDVTTWCRITYGGKSGWVPDGSLERQN